MKAFPLILFLSAVFGLHLPASAEQTGIAYRGVEQFKMEGRATATDASGNHFMVGVYEDYSKQGIDFDPGIGTDLHFTAPGHSSDVFLTKFNADGSYAWTRTWGEKTLTMGSVLQQMGPATSMLPDIFTRRLILTPDPEPTSELQRETTISFSPNLALPEIGSGHGHGVVQDLMFISDW